MTEYTFTYPYDSERKFQSVLARLDESEYIIVKEAEHVKPDDKYSERVVVMQMDAEAALTFRMGMKEVKIRRARTEEELAEEAKIDEMHTVKITVIVDKE